MKPHSFHCNNCTFSCERSNYGKLKIQSPLCTIENSTKCIKISAKISFDSDSFSDDRTPNELIIGMIEIIRAFFIQQQ